MATSLYSPQPLLIMLSGNPTQNEGIKLPMKHTIRTSKMDGSTVDVNLTRGQAIKAMCTECLGFGEVHPKECTSVHCPLYPYRGKTQVAYAK